MEMSEQDKLIKLYQKECQVKTLRAMSEHSGIKISRLFRLLHGSMMRWDEYDLLKNFIEDAQVSSGKKLTLVAEFERFLAVAKHEDKLEIMEKISMIQRLRTTQLCLEV